MRCQAARRGRLPGRADSFPAASTVTHTHTRIWGGPAPLACASSTPPPALAQGTSRESPRASTGFARGHDRAWPFPVSPGASRQECARVERRTRSLGARARPPPPLPPPPGVSTALAGNKLRDWRPTWGVGCRVRVGPAALRRQAGRGAGGEDDRAGLPGGLK